MNIKNLFKRKQKDSKAKLIMMVVTIATVASISNNLNDENIFSNNENFKLLSNETENVNDDITIGELENYMGINKKCDKKEFIVKRTESNGKKYKKLEFKCKPNF